MVAIMYPLTPIDDLRFSRNRDAASSAIDHHFLGRKIRLMPPQRVRRNARTIPQVERVPIRSPWTR
jgi:hypothetical protein